jgi:hypothetical protein
MLSKIFACDVVIFPRINYGQSRILLLQRVSVINPFIVNISDLKDGFVISRIMDKLVSVVTGVQEETQYREYH